MSNHFTAQYAPPRPGQSKSTTQDAQTGRPSGRKVLPPLMVPSRDLHLRILEEAGIDTSKNTYQPLKGAQIVPGGLN